MKWINSTSSAKKRITTYLRRWTFVVEFCSLERLGGCLPLDTVVRQSLRRTFETFWMMFRSTADRQRTFDHRTATQTRSGRRKCHDLTTILSLVGHRDRRHVTRPEVIDGFHRPVTPPLLEGQLAESVDVSDESRHGGRVCDFWRRSNYVVVRCRRLRQFDRRRRRSSRKTRLDRRRRGSFPVYRRRRYDSASFGFDVFSADVATIYRYKHLNTDIGSSLSCVGDGRISRRGARRFNDAIVDCGPNTKRYSFLQVDPGCAGTAGPLTCIQVERRRIRAHCRYRRRTTGNMRRPYERSRLRPNIGLVRLDDGGRCASQPPLQVQAAYALDGRHPTPVDLSTSVSFADEVQSSSITVVCAPVGHRRRDAADAVPVSTRADPTGRRRTCRSGVGVGGVR